MSRGDAFATLKARYCLAAIMIAWYWQPGSHLLARAVSGSGWYWPELVFYYYGDAAIALFLIVAGVVSRIEPGEVIGRPLARKDLLPILLIVVLTFSASTAIVVLMVVPVSYVFPDFVTWWLRWWIQPVVYIAADETIPIGANILSFISVVMLAPLLEELLFRGYLLHRWSRKWGLWSGVLLSSAVFGAFHPDTLAAAVTGLGFAMLYLKTKSLWAPIFAHSIYNLVVWVWDFYGVMSEGRDYYAYTIDDLRDELWHGAIALVVVVLMIDRLLRRNGPIGPFALPELGGRHA